MPTRTILCFGDSNTHGTKAMRSGTDRRRFAKNQRWPQIMRQALAADWEVIAEGHPGRTAVFDDPIEGAHKNGLRALHAIVESHRPVDLVILMLGTNDLKSRFNLCAHDIALGLGRLVREIQGCDSGPDNAAPQVLLAAPVPVLEAGVLAQSFAGAAEKSRQVSAYLQQVAHDHAVQFVDLGQVAQVDPVDGVHLDAAAHAAIGEAFGNAVQKILGPS